MRPGVGLAILWAMCGRRRGASVWLWVSRRRRALLRRRAARAGGLHCVGPFGAALRCSRGRPAPWNSLRSLRSLRSDNHGELEVEARTPVRAGRPRCAPRRHRGGPRHTPPTAARHVASHNGFLRPRADRGESPARPSGKAGHAAPIPITAPIATALPSNRRPHRSQATPPGLRCPSAAASVPPRSAVKPACAHRCARFNF